MDFAAASLVSGRRIRLLNVVDDSTRQCLAAEPDTSLPGLRVARELDRLAFEHHVQLAPPLLT